MPVRVLMFPPLLPPQCGGTMPPGAEVGSRPLEVRESIGASFLDQSRVRAV